MVIKVPKKILATKKKVSIQDISERIDLSRKKGQVDLGSTLNNSVAQAVL